MRIKINQEGLKQKCWLALDLLQRIKGRDITNIELTYDDGTVEKIYVPWSEEDEYTNAYQENRVDTDSITVSIRRKCNHITQ